MLFDVQWTMAMFGLCIFLRVPALRGPFLGNKFGTPIFAAVRGNLLVALIVGIFLLAALVIGPVCVYVFRDKSGKLAELDKCVLCGRSIYSSGVPHAIKDHVVCGQCYKKIEEEKAKTT